MTVESVPRPAPGRLDGVRMVITSAGRGFGRTLAIRCAELGAELHLSARTRNAAERTRDEIPARGHQAVWPYVCDLGEPASIRAFATRRTSRTQIRSPPSGTRSAAAPATR